MTNEQRVQEIDNNLAALLVWTLGHGIENTQLPVTTGCHQLTVTDEEDLSFAVSTNDGPWQKVTPRDTQTIAIFCLCFPTLRQALHDSGLEEARLSVAYCASLVLGDQQPENPPAEPEAEIPLTPAKKAWKTMRERYTPEELAARGRKAAAKAWKTRRARSASSSRLATPS